MKMKKRFWFGEENRWVTLKVSADAMRTIDKLGLATVIRLATKITPVAIDTIE